VLAALPSHLSIDLIMDHATKGAQALSSNNPSSAATEYTLALIEHPTSPDYYIQRSIALTRLNKHQLALKDAETAVLCGYKRSKRERIQEAQHRRVVSYYNLGQYANAQLVLNDIKKWLVKDEKNKSKQMNYDMWAAKVNNKIKSLDQEQGVTTHEKPEYALPSDQKIKDELRRQIKDGSFNVDWESEPVKAAAPVVESEPATTPTPSAAPQKIRHEWYQNANSVIITFYAKGVAKDKLEVDIQEDNVSSLPQFKTPLT
jgi:suppressor of G2 allele of SKP1